MRQRQGRGQRNSAAQPRPRDDEREAAREPRIGARDDARRRIGQPARGEDPHDAGDDDDQAEIDDVGSPAAAISRPARPLDDRGQLEADEHEQEAVEHEVDHLPACSATAPDSRRQDLAQLAADDQTRP